MKMYHKHHILPKSKNGSNNKFNLVKLDIRHHQALHILFNNGTPMEQIERILNIADTALTEEIKYDIRKIIEMTDLDYVYNQGILKD